MSRPLIYLSGPIAACTFSQATDWYSKARRLLHHNLRLLRPMRGKESLSQLCEEVAIGHHASDDPRAPWHMVDDEALSVIATRQAIASRDRWDVQRCDAVLMNLTHHQSRVSIGCMIEAGWADAYRKPLVLVSPADGPHAGHSILTGIATHCVHSLEAACEIINGLFADDY